jgi:predicted DNA-binding transcriptional regulator YafY
MERAQRIGRINVLLQQPQGVTMSQLMEDLSVSRITVIRDLDLMRDQMHAPIVRDRYTYYLGEENETGPAYMLPGLWFTPQQAYAFLTMQNMVEKIAPNLLGPFLDPMRGMLKHMLAEVDFQLYGLDKKIEIDMPAMPTLGDLDFNILLEALVEDRPVRLTLVTPAGKEETLVGVPTKLKITAVSWSIQLQPDLISDPLMIDVGQIRKAVATTGELEEEN